MSVCRGSWGDVAGGCGPFLEMSWRILQLIRHVVSRGQFCAILTRKVRTCDLGKRRVISVIGALGVWGSEDAMWDFGSLARGSAHASARGKLLLVWGSLAPQADALGVAAELQGRHRTPHACVKCAGAFPALCASSISNAWWCGVLRKGCVLQHLLSFWEEGDTHFYFWSPLEGFTLMGFTFGNTFEGRCQIDPYQNPLISNEKGADKLLSLSGVTTLEASKQANAAALAVRWVRRFHSNCGSWATKPPPGLPPPRWGRARWGWVGDVLGWGSHCSFPWASCEVPRHGAIQLFGTMFPLHNGASAAPVVLEWDCFLNLCR